ncbi:MAG TPA: type III pantothenate kinase [Anaerohalosphaeraceae bacterium]|nr:type III pantothenate kinase [Phycisphaerae bacterium]HOL30456.1 type III pantothenate kinase [Anaerohalosphaeraceae bacterium]HPC64075.1 type III pantothenate kinase [Anaerohalosphaeraceae bacterium]HPO69605.1 type III pantothenate kinase [Anaerohalosphaeraceae bacterium]HRS71245.1 type III pantothenate kinase [Anaerohalosphaeraceae bacterium]
MNLIAIDIGNTNIKVAFFLDDEEKLIKSLSGYEAEIFLQLQETLAECWDQIPLVKGSEQMVRDGVIVVSSVKPEWTEMVREAVKDELAQKIMVIGEDIPLPIETATDDPFQVGTDRLVTAAAAYSVIEDAVVVADFGTAVTVDLVDENGVFLGGTISPGFDLSMKAMKAGTARLPQVAMQKPLDVYGANTEEAMRAGVYWSAVGLLETVCRKYAEQLGKWPHVILTGGAAGLIRDDCTFVDSYVPDLAVRGIMIAYKKYLYEKAHIAELDAEKPIKPPAEE